MKASFYHGSVVAVNIIKRNPGMIFCEVIKIIDIDTSNDENILIDQHRPKENHIRMTFIPINEIENFNRDLTKLLIGFSDPFNGQDRWIAVS